MFFFMKIISKSYRTLASISLSFKTVLCGSEWMKDISKRHGHWCWTFMTGLNRKKSRITHVFVDGAIKIIGFQTRQNRDHDRRKTENRNQGRAKTRTQKGIETQRSPIEASLEIKLLLSDSCDNPWDSELETTLNQGYAQTKMLVSLKRNTHGEDLERWLF